MTGLRFLLFSSVLAVFFSAGCRTNQQVRDYGRPTARIVEIKLEDVQIDFATLTFAIEVNNPYPTELPLVGFNYGLTSGGNIFLTATEAGGFSVRPNTKEIVSLPDKIIYERLLRSLNGKAGSTIPYRLELQLRVAPPGRGQIKIPLRHEGSLSLPESVEIVVEGKKYSSLDVIYVYTPHDIVDRMLTLAKVTKEDLVYDLGCGDGRIPVTAAKKYGCKAAGYDLDPERVKESLENARKNNVEHLVTIEQKDIFTLDLSRASVITLYLLPDMNSRLIPQLEKLRPGSRIVTHNFGIPGVMPDKVAGFVSADDNLEHKIFLWTTPLKKIDN
ncbi:MAG: LEA type 2 family protein [Sedimentisphaerales bacterium]|nr:LEA type 2 family protein [Sedimentisphaerales bacterium]